MSSDQDKQDMLNALSYITYLPDSEWIRVNCPFCYRRTSKSDRRESIGYNRESGVCHCFKCKMKVYLDTKEVERILGKRLGKVPGYVAQEIKPEPPEGFTPIWCPPATDNFLFNPAQAFLKSRGIPESVWKQANIGACITGKQAGRVIIPILNKDGTEWAGWVGRTWYHTSKLRYLYSKGFRRENHLLNHQALLVETDEPILVVEGSLDALPYWPNALAVLGKPAKNHLNLFKEARRPVVVCLDGDAWQEGWAFSQKLRLHGLKVGHVRLPPTEDPNSVDREWLVAEAHKAIYG